MVVKVVRFVGWYLYLHFSFSGSVIISIISSVVGCQCASDGWCLGAGWVFILVAAAVSFGTEISIDGISISVSNGISIGSCNRRCYYFCS